jgi:predicted PurR-regulated permease PerM
VTTSSQTSQVIAIARWLLIGAVVWLAWSALSYLASVLSPILAALGIAYLLNPTLEKLVRLGVRRSLGAALLLAVFVAVVVGVVVIFVPKIIAQAEAFASDLPGMVGRLSVYSKQHLGIELPSDWKVWLEKADLSLGDSGREIATAALGGVFSVLGALAEFLLVPVFSFYFLADFPHLLRRALHVVPPRRRATVRQLAREIDAVVSGWVRGQAIVTSILMVLYATGFTIVGMPLSLPIGLLVGLLTVIPFVGTFVGASIAILVTLADGGSTSTLGGVAAVILVLHLLEAGVLTPKITGHKVGLSESGALFAVVAGGKLLGFVGVVLAVPIAATVAVLVRYMIRYYEHTAFFGHESDADVVITPAMAMIMPGVVPGAKIVAEQPVEKQPEPGLESDDIVPELGAAGAPQEPSDEPEPSD